MINVSFYLLNPSSTDTTPIYASISTKGDKNSRRQFATGEHFLVKYCNIGRGKGKELLIKNTKYYWRYKRILNSIEEELYEIESVLKFTNGVAPTPEEIQKKYWMHIGRLKDPSKRSFAEVFRLWQDAHPKWTDGYRKTPQGLINHLSNYMEKCGDISLRDFNAQTWEDITQYFVSIDMANSTTNKNLKTLRRFLAWAGHKSRGYFSDMDELANYGKLKEVEPFKIALKDHELEKWITVDLPDTLDRARDLFFLEFLTGQRYSDIDKVLDRNNYDGNFITIVQQKTGETVRIPRHSELERHLMRLLDKYPEGLPVLENQPFNKYLKEIGKICGFTQKHTYTRQVGNKKEQVTDYRYNFISSHTGRRTFCTVAIKSGIPHPLIMKVTGHQKYDHFKSYVTVDDDDVLAAFIEKF